MKNKYEDWSNPISGIDPEERKNSSLNFNQLLGSVDACVENLYLQGASEKEIRERVNKQITETINKTERPVSDQVISSIRRIKQEADQLDEEDYDELLDQLKHIRDKFEK